VRFSHIPRPYIIRDTRRYVYAVLRLEELQETLAQSLCGRPLTCFFTSTRRLRVLKSDGNNRRCLEGDATELI